MEFDERVCEESFKRRPQSIYYTCRSTHKKMLNTYGYPFGNKDHSYMLATYQKSGFETERVKNYIQNEEAFLQCPTNLRYQFTDDFNLKISDACCKKLKIEPLKKFQKESNRIYSIVGVRRSEGGRRKNAQCLVFKDGLLKKVQPLAPILETWIDWFIEKYDVKLCDLYYPPYSFNRTGCKGCPFNSYLQKDLDVMYKYFPAEAKQCEFIWKPVYEEYRRIGYKLRKEGKNKLF